MAGKEALYLECYAGISGDMFVAALLDLGADEETLRRALDSLPIPGFRVEIRRVRKNGLDACDFCVILDEIHENHDHDMAYLYPQHMDVGEDSPRHLMDGNKHTAHHCHRSLRDVLEILDGAQLTQRARTIACRIFQILGEAEAKAHGTTIEQVHFHEVGAVDSIVDITAAAVCMDQLGFEEVILSVIYEGVGTIRCQHGNLPIPVPAVLNIAQVHSLNLHITGATGEYVTPTGAAIAAAIRTSNRLPRAFSVKKIGLGAGKREQALPGILRAMVIEPMHSCAACDEIYQLNTNIDDCSAEALAYTMERLLAEGAKDVHYTPVFMKKNRPAYLLTVLCAEERVPRMEQIIFAETTSIGIRRVRMKRTVLRRTERTAETSLGTIRVKECLVPEIGGHGAERRCYPEYESVAALCRATGLPYPEVYHKIMKELM